MTVAMPFLQKLITFLWPPAMFGVLFSKVKAGGSVLRLLCHYGLTWKSRGGRSLLQEASALHLAVGKFSAHVKKRRGCSVCQLGTVCGSAGEHLQAMGESGQDCLQIFPDCFGGAWEVYNEGPLSNA